MDLSEVEFKLGVKKTYFWSFEYLCNKVTTFLQYFDSYVKSCHQQLRLNILIHIMESCDIWCSIADYQITKITFKCLQNFIKSLSFCYISHNVLNIINWCCFLKIDWNNSFSFFFFLWLLTEESFLTKFSSADLTPATRCSTEIDNSMCILENVIDIINL